MKVCKFCWTEVENTKRKCPSCGSTDLLHICENCSEHFDGMYCPKCGVKVGQKGKTCPECQTVYYSNACPNCGYTPIRKTTAQTSSSSVSTPPPARPTVTAKTATETIGKTYTPPPLPSSNNLPRKKKKKSWLLWAIVIVVLVAIFGGNSKKDTKTKTTTTSMPVATAVSANEEKLTSVPAKEETGAVSEVKSKPTGAPTDEPMDEMTALQAFYDDFSANGTSDNLEDMVDKYGLYSDYRSTGTGYDYYKVAYDRKLARVISNDDLKTAGNYVVVKIFRLGNDKIEEITFHKDQSGNVVADEIIYENDEKINRYINRFNTANPENKITKELAQTYYHHGQDHDDQIKFSRDGFEVVLTNGYPFKVVIRGEHTKTNDDYKSVFIKYARGYAPEITDETLDSYWEKLLTDIINTVEFDEFECGLTVHGKRIEMIVFEGEIK